jgi:orotate phosphoribosyltransferase
VIDVLTRLTDLGAFYSGEHFVLKSGKHSEKYINPDVALTDPWVMDSATLSMAWPFKDEIRDIVCVGPAFGGNFLAWDVARHLGSLTAYDVKWVATVKLPGGGFAVEPERGFEKVVGGADVLVVEDLLTTGGSVKELIGALVQQWAVNVIGVTVMVNRGGVTAESLGVPRLHAAADITVETDEPDNCRWCAMGRPIVANIGHGPQFRAAHPDYACGYKNLIAA